MNIKGEFDYRKGQCMNKKNFFMIIYFLIMNRVRF